MKASTPIAEKHRDRAGVATVRAGIGNDDVRITIMVDVGDGDPPRVRSCGNSHLTKVLAVRCQVAGNEEQRELVCDAHGIAIGELNSVHTRPGSVPACSTLNFLGR